MAGVTQSLRARLEPVVKSGAAKCARCGDRILPCEAWDLGHDDFDRSRYVGPEHRRCNRATAGRRASKGYPLIRSRRWSDDPPPGTICCDEIYLSHGIWETIPAGSERD
jgi:hypothetical protein